MTWSSGPIALISILYLLSPLFKFLILTKVKHYIFIKSFKYGHDFITALSTQKETSYCALEEVSNFILNSENSLCRLEL